MAKPDIRVEIDLGDITRFPDYIKALDKITKESIDEVIGVVFEQSQNLVPVNTGALKESGQIIEDPNGNFISYGSEIVNYAVEVHENLTDFHPHGQAKYLEVPLVMNARTLREKITNRMNEEFKGRFM